MTLLRSAFVQPNMTKAVLYSCLHLMVFFLIPHGQVTALDFAMDGPFDVSALAYIVGQEQGFFQEQKIPLTLHQGHGSIDVFKKIASGDFPVGMADFTHFLYQRHLSENYNDVVAVLMIYQKPTAAIFTRKTKKFRALQDLVGSRIGVTRHDVRQPFWQSFLSYHFERQNGLQVMDVSLARREILLAADRLDAMGGDSIESYNALIERGIPEEEIQMFLLADYGLPYYGKAIFVHRDYIENKPDQLKSFLSALIQSWQFIYTQRQQAVKSYVKHVPWARPGLISQKLSRLLQYHILGQDIAVQGFGSVESKRLAQSLQKISDLIPEKIRKARRSEQHIQLAPNQLFTADYLPPLSQRLFFLDLPD